MRLSKALLLVALLGLALPAFADDEASSARSTVETHTIGSPRPVKDICSLPAETGPCKAAIPRWYYDKFTKSCTHFVWGGCGGNANNFKTKEECEKRCGKPICACPKILRPVCGSDGNTYDNECLAKCAGVKVQCKKACPCKDDCFCIQVFDPVCGADGKTYGNSCEAGCAGVKVACEGECPCNDDCICPLLLAPVCGVDGKTYDNDCFAGCAGVKVACKGECPCKPQCDNKPVDCVVDPCRFAKCPAFPDADCIANRCTCTAEFFVKGKKVDCTIRNCIKKDDPCGGFLGKNGVFTPRGRKCCDKLECCVCFPRPLDIVKPIPIKGFCGTNCPVCKG